MAIRAALRRQAVEATGLGRVGLVALVAAFFGIHLSLALRAPVLPFEAVAIMAARSGGLSPEDVLIRIGEAVLPGATGARIGFLVLWFFTVLATMRMASALFASGLAVAVAAIWLNTSLLYGLGAGFAAPAAVTAFGLTAMMWALIEARARDRPALWSVFTIMAVLTLWTDPRLLVVVPGLMLVDISDRDRNAIWRRRGYWQGLLAGTAAGGAKLWLTGYAPLWASLAAMPDLVGLAAYPRQLLMVFLLVTPGVAAFCFLGLWHAIGGLLIGHRIVLRPPVYVLGPLTVLWLATGMPFDLAMIGLPLTVVLAAGHAVRPKRFFQRWWAEAATPLSFGLFVLATGALLFPANPLSQRIEVLERSAGWAGFAGAIERRAMREDAGWIAFAEKEDAALAGVYSNMLPVIWTKGGPGRVDCDQTGLLAAAAGAGPDVAMGQFRSFRRAGQVARGLQTAPMARYVLWVVARPVDGAICR